VHRATGQGRFAACFPYRDVKRCEHKTNWMDEDERTIRGLMLCAVSHHQLYDQLNEPSLVSAHPHSPPPCAGQKQPKLFVA